MSQFSVGVAFSARPWRVALQRYVRDHVGGIAIRMVRDPRMALEEQLDVLVVDDEASFLTAPFVERLHDRGVRVLGVYEPEEPDRHGEALLARLGVEAAVPATIGAEEMVGRLVELSPDGSLEERFDAVVAGLDGVAESSRGGVLIAVGGPPGAGATEIAIHLAAALARSEPVVLVDVDEVNPGVARRLALALHPHLLTALDGVRGRGLGDVDGPTESVEAALAHPITGAAPLPFDVVVGLANRADWALARATDITDLLGVMARRWARVVANLGPHLEDLSRYVDRYGASRATLAEADLVVGACEATPRGLARFLDWLADASAAAPGVRPHAVINRAPRSPARRAELIEELAHETGQRLASITVVPDDPAVARAGWDGVLVGRGRFATAIEELAATVAPGPTPNPAKARRWRRRKVAP